VLLERIRAERKARFIEDAAETARAKAETKARDAGKPWTQADDQKALEQHRAKAEKKYKEPEPVDTTDLRELPEGWCWASIDEITNNHDGIRVPIKRADRAKRQGDYPYYGASGVVDAIDEYLFNGEHLLISEDGANLLARSTPIAFRASGKFWVNNHAHVVSLFGELQLEYLEHYLNGITLRPYVTGTAQPKLTQKSMNRIPIPLAPLAETVSLVQRISERFSAKDNLSSLVAGTTRKVGFVTSSILAKAFRGELAPQDPNDEPASVLLERIREERAAAAPAKKKRKSKK
jgi:type I restriction enzyme S subunit